MPRQPYAFTVEIDGHRVRGEWRLKQGGLICVVALGYGPARDYQLGRADPDAFARAKLPQLVAAWWRDQARQARAIERETRRIAAGGRPRSSRPPKRKTPAGGADGRSDAD